LNDGSLLGRLLHTLIGYTATPDGAQLLAYGLVIAFMLALMRVARGKTTPSHQPVRSSP
jgi:high-affinity iron transporter